MIVCPVDGWSATTHTMPLLSSTTLAMNTHVAPSDRHKGSRPPPESPASGPDIRRSGTCLNAGIEMLGETVLSMGRIEKIASCYRSNSSSSSSSNTTTTTRSNRRTKTKKEEVEQETEKVKASLSFLPRLHLPACVLPGGVVANRHSHMGVWPRVTRQAVIGSWHHGQ